MKTPDAARNPRTRKYPWALLLVLVSMATAGCAAMQNTLAQDLAWERWEKCQQSGINLSRIEADGRTWVTYTADHTAALNAWRECYWKVAAEQGQRAKPEATIAVTSPQGRAPIAGPIAKPAWKVGNEWAYRYEQPSGTGTFVWRLDRTETLNNEPHYVITAGAREIFYRVSDLGFTQEILDGRIIRRVSPSVWRFVSFPLSVGLSWDMKYQETRPTEHQTEEVERRCVAEAEETLTVPAGTFATIRIVCHNTRNNAWVSTLWYSPEVTHIVRDEYVVRAGGRGSRELLKFRLQ